MPYLITGIAQQKRKNVKKRENVENRHHRFVCQSIFAKVFSSQNDLQKVFKLQRYFRFAEFH